MCRGGRLVRPCEAVSCRAEQSPARYQPRCMPVPLCGESLFLNSLQSRRTPPKLLPLRLNDRCATIASNTGNTCSDLQMPSRYFCKEKLMRVPRLIPAVTLHVICALLIATCALAQQAAPPSIAPVPQPAPPSPVHLRDY